MLVVDLAIRAYQMDSGRPPSKLLDLVPKYLPVVPDDPCAAGPMKYRVEEGRYTIYSIGPDGDDDGGKPIVAANGVEDGDYSDAELFPQPSASQSPSNSAQ